MTITKQRLAAKCFVLLFRELHLLQCPRQLVVRVESFSVGEDSLFAGERCMISSRFVAASSSCIWLVTRFQVA